MNKEEKKQLEDLIKTQQELLEWARQKPSAPILFSADCELCGKPTVHVSHIIGEKPNLYPIAPIEPKALRTCLQCGHTVYLE